MKVSFRSRKLETLETQPDDQGFPPDAVRAFRKVMQLLRAAVDERDIYALKSLRCKKLEGARSHQRSLRLNDQWRLIIEIDDDSSPRQLVIIAVEDYH